MTKRKRVLRRILDLRPHGGTTRRGNPEWWRVLMECGHIKFAAHSIRQTVCYMATQVAGSSGQDLDLEAVCGACGDGRPMDSHADLICMRDFNFLRGPALAALCDAWEAKGLSMAHLREPKEVSK